ncbi:MAG: hypothetical protein RIT81_25615 [Deltaproteobacteria bacterium]
MTPRIGFLRRAALGLALGSGLTAACAVGPSPEAEPSTVEHPVLAEPDRRVELGELSRLPTEQRLWAEPDAIEASLARLEALEVLDVADLVGERTAHAWIPYGGFWSEAKVEMGEEEIARRLEHFVDVAEAAAATVETIPQGAQGVCWPATPEAFCLTITDHAADLAALDDLEIVDVDGVVRDNAQVDGVCYSSWETVSEDVCLRALKAHAIVEATADFPSRRPPEEPGE